MSQSRKNPVGFTATEALEAFRRVKLTSGSGTAVEYADAGEAAIGVTVSAAALGEMVLVSLVKAGETHKVTCSGAVVGGAPLYGTNDGKVDDAGTGATIGVALEAGSGNGSVIEAILDQDSALNLPHIADVAASTQTALTDNGGGTADGTVESQAAPAALTGTLTGTVNGALVDIAAAAGNCGGSASPAASDVDTAIATAVAPIVTGVNEQNKELMTRINDLVTLAGVAQNNLKEVTTQLAAAKADSDAQVTKINAILARLEAAGISAAS
ncbi:MAG: hypothetical protein BWX86_01151 [Verrucomicrobia bacterium ADurb.Bin122]|nr:MAG: hypothetical protein BWX86_01151 [Verrucomicrobia bacterium ADurb.Bin122]